MCDESDASMLNHTRKSYRALQIDADVEDVAARAWMVANGAAAAAGGVLVQDDSFTAHAHARGAAAVVRAARGAALSLGRVLDDRTVKVDDLRLVNHVAVDAPNVGELAGHKRVLMHIHKDIQAASLRCKPHRSQIMSIQKARTFKRIDRKEEGRREGVQGS
jgi:hypothetical protein